MKQIGPILYTVVVLILVYMMFSGTTYGQSVYVTKSGKKLHSDSSCIYLRYSKIALELEDALDKGYTVSICRKADIDSVTVMPSTLQCSGITKKELQCKREIRLGLTYCWQHRNN